jgi:hypothetical protein
LVFDSTIRTVDQEAFWSMWEHTLKSTVVQEQTGVTSRHISASGRKNKFGDPIKVLVWIDNTGAKIQKTIYEIYLT